MAKYFSPNLLDADEKLKLFHFQLIFIIIIGLIHFLVLFMNFTVLFQLIFAFIYSTFNNNFSILIK